MLIKSVFGALMIKKSIFLVSCILVVSLGFVLKTIDDFMSFPMAIPEEGIVLEVQKGSNLRSISWQLHEALVLQHPNWLILVARLCHRSDIILAGEYRLEKGLTPAGLRTMLASGKVINYSVTLIEGWTFKQAIEILHDQPMLGKKLLSSENQFVLNALGISKEYNHPEGLFFPDTYQYTKGMTDLDILKRAHQSLLQVLQEEWQSRQADSLLNSPYEGLILASIIEKETGQASERQHIAAVFSNRLKKKMRLQTDPTVIYGLGDRYTGNLKRQHLHEKNSYNTYVIKGLPPTPIALAGRQSIHAAFNPSKNKSLYFVAMGDGSHYFSSTIEEHNKAVRKYQKYRRVKAYRSTPK